MNCEKCEHEPECRGLACFYELFEKEKQKIIRDTINEFNLRCEIEMNAHEPYKMTKPLNLERLHKVRDMMLEQLKEQKNENIKFI